MEFRSQQRTLGRLDLSRFPRVLPGAAVGVLVGLLLGDLGIWIGVGAGLGLLWDFHRGNPDRARP